MDPIRSILAVTDFTSGATHAARRAAMLAAESGARMTLLHVVERDMLLAVRDWLARGRDLRGAVEAQARMQLDAEAAQIEQEHGVRVERMLRVGRPLDEVHAASIESDLVVLGALGGGGALEEALGTLADRLVRTAARPVLVVKRPPAAPYAHALVLTDFSAAAQAALQATLPITREGTLHLLHAFSIPFEGKLRLASVSDADIAACRRQLRDRALAEMEQTLAAVKASRRSEASVVPGEIRAEVLRALDLLQPDLVAVGKQGDSLLEDVLLGSTTSHVLAHAGGDVLVVPRRAAPGLQGAAGTPQA